MGSAPARPSRQERGIIRRQQILAEAIRAFGDRGYHAVSMQEIAEAVGVTKPALYLHYASKERLLTATVEEVGRSLVSEITTVANRGLGTSIDPAPVLEELYSVLVADEGRGVQILMTSRWVSDEATAAASRAMDDIHGSLRAAIAARSVLDSACLEDAVEMITASAVYDHAVLPLIPTARHVGRPGVGGRGGPRRDRNVLPRLLATWSRASAARLSG